jgi:hypothetical protein
MRQYLTGSCFGLWGAWHTGNDITVRFILVSLYRWSVDIFCLSLSVEKFFKIFRLAGESSLGAKIGGFRGF